MNTEKNCQSCGFYKDGYCENLELKPNYPEKACDYFSRQNEENIALAFQLGIAFGFAKRYNEMDKIMEEIKRAVMPQKESEEFSYKPINPFQDDGLSSEDRAMIDGIRNTAYVCGYRGGDVEYAVHKALKRMGRYDLLPPCEQESEG